MRTCAALVMLLALPALATAQDRTPPPASGLTLERVHNDFVVAPDFKITDVDGQTGNLVGVSVGMLQQDTFFVGGAGYWLANGSENDFEMMYGGLTLGGTSVPSIACSSARGAFSASAGRRSERTSARRRAMAAFAAASTRALPPRSAPPGSACRRIFSWPSPR